MKKVFLFIVTFLSFSSVGLTFDQIQTIYFDVPEGTDEYKIKIYKYEEYYNNGEWYSYGYAQKRDNRLCFSATRGVKYLACFDGATLEFDYQTALVRFPRSYKVDFVNHLSSTSIKIINKYDIEISLKGDGLNYYNSTNYFCTLSAGDYKLKLNDPQFGSMETSFIVTSVDTAIEVLPILTNDLQLVKFFQVPSIINKIVVSQEYSNAIVEKNEKTGEFWIKLPSGEYSFEGFTSSIELGNYPLKNDVNAFIIYDNPIDVAFTNNPLFTLLNTPDSVEIIIYKKNGEYLTRLLGRKDDNLSCPLAPGEYVYSYKVPYKNGSSNHISKEVIFKEFSMPNEDFSMLFNKLYKVRLKNIPKDYSGFRWGRYFNSKETYLFLTENGECQLPQGSYYVQFDKRYYFTVIDNDVVVTLPELSYSEVIFENIPSGVSQIVLRGGLLGYDVLNRDFSGNFNVQIPYGDYSFEFHSNGYWAGEGDFIVNQPRCTVPELRLYNVTFSSSEESCWIPRVYNKKNSSVDHNPSGCTLRLSHGEYYYELSNGMQYPFIVNNADVAIHLPKSYDVTISNVPGVNPRSIMIKSLTKLNNNRYVDVSTDGSATLSLFPGDYVYEYENFVPQTRYDMMLYRDLFKVENQNVNIILQDTNKVSFINIPEDAEYITLDKKLDGNVDAKFNEFSLKLYGYGRTNSVVLPNGEYTYNLYNTGSLGNPNKSFSFTVNGTTEVSIPNFYKVEFENIPEYGEVRIFDENKSFAYLKKSNPYYYLPVGKYYFSSAYNNVLDTSYNGFFMIQEDSLNIDILNLNKAIFINLPQEVGRIEVYGDFGVGSYIYPSENEGKIYLSNGTYLYDMYTLRNVSSDERTWIAGGTVTVNNGDIIIDFPRFYNTTFINVPSGIEYLSIYNGSGIWILDFDEKNSGKIAGQLPSGEYYCMKNGTKYLFKIEDGDCTIDFNALTSIKKKSNQEEIALTLYPNPILDYVNIKVMDGDVVKRAELISLKGMVERNFVSSEVDSEVTFSLSGIKKGLYFFRVYTNKGAATKLILKQ